jgi:hypothetical protein
MAARHTRFAVVGVTFGALVAPAIAQAQSTTASRPFPSPAAYPHGYIPSAVTASVVQSSYDHWKSTYVKSDCGSGYLYVDSGSPKGVSYSEGMGYGMVLSAYLGDLATFQGLWKFIQKNLNGNKLMGWEVNCAGFDQTDNGGGGDNWTEATTTSRSASSSPRSSGAVTISRRRSRTSMR